MGGRKPTKRADSISAADLDRLIRSMLDSPELRPHISHASIERAACPQPLKLMTNRDLNPAARGTRTPGSYPWEDVPGYLGLTGVIDNNPSSVPMQRSDSALGQFDFDLPVPPTTPVASPTATIRPTRPSPPTELPSLDGGDADDDDDSDDGVQSPHARPDHPSPGGCYTLFPALSPTKSTTTSSVQAPAIPPACLATPVVTRKGSLVSPSRAAGSRDGYALVPARGSGGTFPRARLPSLEAFPDASHRRGRVRAATYTTPGADRVSDSGSLRAGTRYGSQATAGAWTPTSSPVTTFADWENYMVIPSPASPSVFAGHTPGSSMSIVRRDSGPLGSTGGSTYPDCFFEDDDDDEPEASERALLWRKKWRERGWSEAYEGKWKREWTKWFCCGLKQDEE